MLASLLPGIRVLRAPLAAGFVWLTALWFLLEPSWSASAADVGVIASAARLLDVVNLVAQGALVSFLAYILGSFSVFAFSRPLLSLIQTRLEVRPHRLAGLSALGRESLAQVAVDGRQRLEQALALSGVAVDEVLGLSRVSPDSLGSRGKIAPAGFVRSTGLPTGRSAWRRAISSKVRSAWRRAAVPMGLSADWVLPTPEERQERELAERILRDLPVVAQAQLLGKEAEVYGAVDRSRAEVEFRVALVPPLAALSLAIGAATGNALGMVLAPLVGGLAAVGLMLDAGKQTRESNDLILSLMEHGRLKPPSLIRAESEAVSRGDQAPAKVVARQAEEAARALRQYLASLEAVPSSGSLPMLTQAYEASQRAHTEATRLDRLLAQYLPPPSSRSTSGEWVLEPLDRVLSGWATINEGLGLEARIPRVAWADERPSPEELLDLIRQARDRNREFVDAVRAAVGRIAAQDAGRRAAPGDLPAGGDAP